MGVYPPWQPVNVSFFVVIVIFVKLDKKILLLLLLLHSPALSPETLLILTADDVREIRDSVVRHSVDGLDQ